MALHVDGACGIVMCMKAIQITMEEKLLERLDAYPEAGRRGRSAVVREAVAAYLAAREAEDIDLGLERAYRPGSPPDELEGWAGEAVWLDE